MTKSQPVEAMSRTLILVTATAFAILAGLAGLALWRASETRADLTRVEDELQSLRREYDASLHELAAQISQASAQPDLYAHYSTPLAAALNDRAPYEIVRAFYATDRNLVDSDDPDTRYGHERSRITYGTTSVSIPRDHRMGKLEEPSWLRMDVVEDLEKHVVLLSVNPLKKADFFGLLRARIKESENQAALVFIHGYNVTFKDASRRTAQMAYDLGFDGAPIFYSWPSQAREAAYPIDEENVRWSEPQIKNFLLDILNGTPAQRIYLVAHSMGNRAMTGAFTELVRENPSARSRFREIILAAPDIDADIFTRDIAPRIVGTSPAATQVTLYASSRDLALKLSKGFHGYRRAGDTNGGPTLFPGIETIDATAVDTSLVGHSYYGDNRSIISDMYYLLQSSNRACKRAGLRDVPTRVGKLCRFRP